MNELKIKKAMVVYQGGIANVFEVDNVTCQPIVDRKARRIMQGSFRECELVARGLELSGSWVVSAYCNQAGDIIEATWSLDLEDAPFCDQFRPVGDNKVGGNTDIKFDL